MFMLWNETDHVFASPETFATEGAAVQNAKDFCQRFAAQGYYKTASGERIPPEDIQLFVVLTEG